MIGVRLGEVVELLGATAGPDLDPAGVVTGVGVDSRSIGPGDLFVALPGEHVDGHTFVRAALERGALGALTARPVPGTRRCLVVPDPLAALGRLARHQVDLAHRTGLRVVGITGSQGKTSTKDLVAQVLESAGPTVAPYGNLNNELGVPLTVARIEESTRFLIVEMGARGVGHIAYLCGVAPPDVAVALNVGHAHVGEFGDQAAIARAKGEIVEALPAEGTAVLNADDPLVWAMRGRTAAEVLAFGVGGEPAASDAVWATDMVADNLGRCRFRLHARAAGRPPGDVEVRLGVSGRHQVANATAAAAVAIALGLGLTEVAAGLSGAGIRSHWRMELEQRADGVLVINDAYNANPESMRAAVHTLAEIGADRRPRQSWAVLGDMLELGPTAAAEHRMLGRLVAETGIERLVAVGEYAEEMVAGAQAHAGGRSLAVWSVPDKAAATELVLARLQPGDVILVKASRGLALDTVAAAILAADPVAEQHAQREDSA